MCQRTMNSDILQCSIEKDTADLLRLLFLVIRWKAAQTCNCTLHKWNLEDLKNDAEQLD